MKDEFILILDDDSDKGGKLEQAISDEGFDCELVENIDDAKNLLSTGKVTLCVFDIWLGKNKTSIDFASKINPILPTLFITQFSKSPKDRYFQLIIEKLPHSTYLARTAVNWTDDVIKGITLAKEKFRLFQFSQGQERKETIPIKDVITFSEYNSANRFFIRREDLLFITTDKNRFKDGYDDKTPLNHGLEKQQIDVFNKGLKDLSPYACVFYTTSGKFIRFGKRLGDVETELNNWKNIGWNFLRTHNQYIVNMNLLEKLEIHGNKRVIKLKNCIYSIPSTQFNSNHASDWFPFLRFD